MKFNVSDEQKKMLLQAVLTAVVTLVIAVAAIFGINVIAPSPAAQFQAESVGGIQPGQVFRFLDVVNSINNRGTLTQVGASTFTGAVTMNGALAATAVSVKGTPVTWATPQPTYAYTAPTVAPSVTPRPTSTPELLYGNTPAAVKEICKTVDVIGQATVVFPGITTPQAVGPVTFNNSGLGNADLVTFDKAAGVVTIYTYRVVLGTPAAATTVVALDVCAKGN